MCNLSCCESNTAVSREVGLFQAFSANNPKPERHPRSWPWSFLADHATCLVVTRGVVFLEDDVDDDPTEEGAHGLLEASDRGTPSRQRGSGGGRPQERQQIKTREVWTSSVDHSGIYREDRVA